MARVGVVGMWCREKQNAEAVAEKKNWRLLTVVPPTGVTGPYVGEAWPPSKKEVTG